MRFDRISKDTQQTLQNSAYDLNKALSRSDKLFPTKVCFNAIRASHNGYIKAVVKHRTSTDVDALGLSDTKLAELYEVPVTEAAELINYINNSPFKDAVGYKDGMLQLDESIVAEIITERSTITLTKPQEEFIRQLERVEREYFKLHKYTQSPDQLYRVDSRQKAFYPNLALIKHFV